MDGNQIRIKKRALFLIPLLLFLFSLSSALADNSLQKSDDEQVEPMSPEEARQFIFDQMNVPDAENTPDSFFNTALPACTAGTSGGYACSNIGLGAFLAKASMGGGTNNLNDIWGWVDSSGNEYALVGRTNGTAFVDITNPAAPNFLGMLPGNGAASSWRDIKVYNDHAFIVSESNGHGMQVFDLNKLPGGPFTADAQYNGFGSAHNIVINEDSGWAYGVGTTACSGGLAFVDVSNPLAPVGGGCFASDGYTHDAHCVIYNGPDLAHIGSEICFAYNEDTVTIVDVSNKGAPVQLSRTTYAGSSYTHQGWLTEDHRYAVWNDETDEQGFGHNTRTRILNVVDLDAPIFVGFVDGPTAAIDHNMYVMGNRVYASNYRAGLRVMDLSNVGAGALPEVAFFDVYNGSDTAAFNGNWSNYPWYPSGSIALSHIENGLFVVQPDGMPSDYYMKPDVVVLDSCGANNTSVMSLTSIYGHTANVALTFNDGGAGLGVSITPATGTIGAAPTRSVVVSPGTAAAGTYLLTITADDGTNSYDEFLSVDVCAAPPPQIVVNPMLVDVTQAIGTQVITPMTIDNVGGLDLTWTITEALGFAGPPPAQFNAEGKFQFLTGPSTEAHRTVAFNYLDSYRIAAGLTVADIADASVIEVSNTKGWSQIELNQTVNGIELYNQAILVNIAKDGSIINLHDRFVPNLAGNVNTTAPTISAADAVAAAASHLGLDLVKDLEVELSPEGTPNQAVVFAPNNLSQNNIPVGLVYQLTGEGDVRLAWELEIKEINSYDWWSMRIDAVTGEILDQFNYTIHEDYIQQANDAHGAGHVDGLRATADANAARLDALAAAQGANAATAKADTYQVFAWPVESPNHSTPANPADGRTTENNPVADATAVDPNASPLGWHDDGTTARTTTQGNNVDAQKTGANSDCGAGLDCVTPLDLTVAPTAAQNVDAAIDNLFYWNNIIHDVWYMYGFDEVARNFQEDNNGQGGAGGDSVTANAQAPGNCNANMGTPADGANPTMNMFICDIANPDRDGDFDNGVIAHEYSHGISNRMTGGASVACLGNAEQMGEGWGDLTGLLMTIEPGDTGADSRGIGTWLLGEGPGGAGVRTTPYSTDTGINNHTYQTSRTMVVPHGVGEVWASIIWEVTWELIANSPTHPGFDPDIYAGTGGNNLMMELMNRGMGLQPCSPGYVDGRDAILAADQALTGGANACTMWTAFARRGLGFDAVQGASTSNADNTDGFALPPACLAVLQITKTASPDPVLAGTQLSYSILVDNATAGTLTGLVVTDPILADQTYVPASASCAPFGTGSEAGGTVTFNIPTLTTGQTTTCTFDVTINPAVGGGAIFADDFEAGLGNWTPTGLWNLQNAGCQAPYPSPTQAAYFGQTGTCTYDTGAAAAGTLTNATPFDLSSANSPVLTFEYFLNTEKFAGYDEAFVEVSADGAVWATTQLNTEDAWTTQAIDMTAYAGDPTVFVRFRFDTVDGQFNAFLGLLIDDVSIDDVYFVDNEACVTAVEGDNACSGVIQTEVTANPTPPGPQISTPASDSSTQDPGTVVPANVAVTNIGDADLIWTGAEDGNNNCASPTDIPWITGMTPTGATTPAAGSTVVNFNYDSTGMTAGTYTAQLCFASNDTSDPMVMVALTLTVNPPCTAPSDVPWLSVDVTSGTTIPAGSTPINVTTDSNAMGAGTYVANLCVNSNDAATPLVQVPVTMTVSGNPPVIDISPAALTSTQASNTTNVLPLTITNNGAAPSTLTWNIWEGNSIWSADHVAESARRVSSSNATESLNPTFANRFAPSADVRFVTGPNAGEPIDIALNYIQSNQSTLGITAADLASYRVTDNFTSRGTTHIYFRQELNGIPVWNGDIAAHIASDGSIIALHNQWAPDLANTANTQQPTLSAEQAVQRAAQLMKIPTASTLLALNAEDVDAVGAVGPELEGADKHLFAGGNISRADIPAQLMYINTENGPRLGWYTEIYELNADNWWVLIVDAVNGDLLWEQNLYIHEDFIEQYIDAHGHAPKSSQTDYAFTLEVLDNIYATQQELNAFADTYTVYPWPAESPEHVTPLPPADSRTVVSNPVADATAVDPNASPFGWHTGNVTTGNNVDARKGAARYNCGATLDCNPGINLSVDPTTAPNVDAALVSLFYWNNILHDVWYLHGFDEASGNFQENNNGQGGAGGDSVNGNAQATGNCNANFSTPADGGNGTMNMFLCNIATPQRDGDHDAGVVGHELGHGISIRQTGGPGNSGCLNNTEQMGEGWGDITGMLMTIEPGDLGTDARGIGTYLFGEPANGPGIRDRMYSTDFGVDERTYDFLKTGPSVPHGVGSVWAAVVWEMTWELINNGVSHSGLNLDIYENGAAMGGNNLAMTLVNEGYKLQQCSPGFVSGRDAILLADQNLFGGANQCVLWTAFARRGLGDGAAEGSTANINDGTEDFTIPASCSYLDPQAPTAVEICQGDPASFLINVGPAYVSGNANMSVVGGPPQPAYNFTVNPAPASSSTTLNVTGTGTATPGAYTLTITGDNGTESGSSDVNLTVSAPLAGAPTLASPADGATGQSNTLLLSWNAFAGSTSYLLEVDDNSDFSSIYYSNSLAGTSDTVTGLAPLTTYYWRVTPSNLCGAASTSAVFDFTTANIVCNSYTATDTPRPIPAAGTGPGSQTSTITVADSGAITDVDVTLVGTHTWMGDLDFDLTSPSTTLIGILDAAACGNTDNFDTGLDDESATAPGCPIPTDGTVTQAETPLSAFDTEEVNGNWVLTINDDAGGDSGSLTNFTLDICFIPPPPPNPTINLPASDSSTQATNTTVASSVNVGNVGGVDLNWTVVEDSAANCAAPADITWITGLLPASGTTIPAGSDPVNFTYDSAGLAAGTYNAQLCFASNDPATPMATVALTLTVPDPTIGVAPASDSSTQFPDQVVASSITVDNVAGGSDLVWTIAEDSAANCAAPTDITWITNLTPAGATTAPGNNDVVTFDYDSAGMAPGVYNAQFCISSNDPATPMVQVPLTLTVDPPPPACSFVQDIPWITSLTPNSGSLASTASDIVSVTFDSAGMVDGVYTANLCVDSNDGVTPLVVVPVTLVVDNGCAAPGDVLDLAIAPNATFVDLSWTGSGANQYEVHQATMPYTAPVGNGPTVVGQPAVGPFTDNTVANTYGNPATNYYYYLLPENTCGAWANPSNHVGEFDFSIIPGA